MELIEIVAKDDTPYILLDAQKGILEIKGRSYPENPQTFYAPVFDWIRNCINNDTERMYVYFCLEYFNTTSFKIIFDMLFELESTKTSYDVDMKIFWYYDTFSPDVKEAGLDLSELIQLPFEISELL